MNLWQIDNYEGTVLAGMATNTRLAYRTDVLGFSCWTELLGLGEPADVGRPHVLAWVEWLITNQYAPSSVNRKVSALRKYWTWATRRGLVDRPHLFSSKRVLVREHTRRLPRIPDYEELDALLALPAGLEHDPQEIQTSAVLELLYGSGLRVSELTGLDLGSVDTTELRVRVWGKGSIERIVPISERSARAVETHLDAARPKLLAAPVGEALFIAGRRSSRLQPRAVRRLLDVRSNYRLHPHQLRHACATHMLEGGADIRYIQAMLGHQHLTSTAWYAQVSPQMLKQAVETHHPRG